MPPKTGENDHVFLYYFPRPFNTRFHLPPILNIPTQRDEQQQGNVTQKQKQYRHLFTLGRYKLHNNTIQIVTLGAIRMQISE